MARVASCDGATTLTTGAGAASTGFNSVRFVSSSGLPGWVANCGCCAAKPAWVAGGVLWATTGRSNTRGGGLSALVAPPRTLFSVGATEGVSTTGTLATRIDTRRYAPAPVMDRDFRRSSNEQVYEANVTSVHAVVGPPEQRCWVEQEQVVQERSNNSIPGTVVGAVIGGILGHQVGGGRGQDIATAGGAVAGAVVGNNIGRNSGGGQQVTTQNVQRCSSAPGQARPEYWDVTYTFRGQEHRMQMSTPPGPSITVNERGEPRV